MADTLRRAWLSNEDLAERYGVAVATVRGWRNRGTGPAGRRFGGAVRYSLSDVEAWELTQPTTQSTPAA